MAGKKKEFNKKGAFQRRFKAKFYESDLTQEAMASALGVSRPTLFGWLEGKNLPDILSLEKIARYFDVSADYLLGLSNTESIDASVRAAAEYTGLSEEAVKCLHIGLDDSECDGEGISGETKAQNLKAASALIVDKAFTEMIYHLKEVSLEAYLEQVLGILESEYSECGSPEEDPEFRYAKQEDRDVVVANLIHVLQEKCPWRDKGEIIQCVMATDDDALATDVFKAHMSAKESNEVHQFHAAKAFTGYIDQLVNASYKSARQRFEKQIE